MTLACHAMFYCLLYVYYDKLHIRQVSTVTYKDLWTV
jgi:hypothetical protein